MNIESLIRKNIRSLKPYHSARQDFLSGVLLDANENSFGSVLDSNGTSLHRYPDPYQSELRSKLAELNGVSMNSVFVGVGSDEVIDLLIRVFCEPERDSILILEPTYGMYRVAASIQNTIIRTCLLDESFHIDVAATMESINQTTKLVFCCSPNNPTANLLKVDDILALCKRDCIVVVDEAYIDFAHAESLSKYIVSIPNLVVMRTLSKAWGLAGIRLGYCIASPTIISYMLKVKAPYNINSLTSKAALSALQKIARKQATVNTLIAERQWLAEQLSHLPFVQKVYPSDANFILIRCENATTMYQALAKRTIIVRNRSTEPRLQNCLRITVGTRTENETLISTWKEVLA